jgi:hypothetical protein
MKTMLFPAALLASLTLTGACTQFPQLDHTSSPELANSDYPMLVPLGPVLAAIDARVSALQARAARLRGSVLSGAERQRLANGLQ